MEILLEHFKEYDIKIPLRYLNYFSYTMDSMGSLIPQNSFKKVTQMEVITMYKPSLDSPLYQ